MSERFDLEKWLRELMEAELESRVSERTQRLREALEAALTVCDKLIDPLLLPPTMNNPITVSMTAQAIRDEIDKLARRALESE